MSDGSNKLTLRSCADVIPDWWVIELAEHDGVEELRPTGPNSASWFSSARMSDADVEGTSAEMMAIAVAIELREYVGFKRCAVDASKEPVEFWSPRNSQRPGMVSRASAEALAKEIREKCAPAAGGGR